MLSPLPSSLPSDTLVGAGPSGAVDVVVPCASLERTCLPMACAKDTNSLCGWGLAHYIWVISHCGLLALWPACSATYLLPVEVFCRRCFVTPPSCQAKVLEVPPDSCAGTMGSRCRVRFLSGCSHDV